jgi:hypothetical protein
LPRAFVAPPASAAIGFAGLVAARLFAADVASLARRARRGSATSAPSRLAIRQWLTPPPPSFSERCADAR